MASSSWTGVEGVAVRAASGVSGTRAAVAAMLALALLAAATAPASADTVAALAAARGWLVAQQRPDGSFGAGGELLPRDSAVALQALGGVPGDPVVASALAYLEGAGGRGAQYEALRVTAFAAVGSPFEPLLDDLGELRNGDGFGAFGTYHSNLYDTILAVEAYREDERDRLLDLVPLLDYLIAGQGGDGGWGFLPGTPSQVYYTGEALWALARLDALDVAPQVIDGARAYLLARQRADGGFGSVLETAVAYRGLAALGHRFAAGQPDPVAALLAAQAADGSWEGDAYTTAEVMRALAAHQANLVVSGLSASATEVAAGTPITVTVTVHNIGPLRAGASRLALRAAAAASPDQRAEAAVPALEPGASFEAILPVATTGDRGELVLYAVADADGVVAEQVESDNTRSLRIAIRELPDLAIFPAQITVSPPRPRPASSFQLRAVSQNLGEQPVPSFTWRISRLEAGAPVATLAEGTAGPLAAGGSLLLTANGSLPAGEHTVLVELDLEDSVEEVLEEDNRATQTFFVADDTLPDFALAAADLQASPADPAPGETVSFSLTVRNAGTRQGTALVEVFDGDPAAAGVAALAQSVTLAAGASTTLSGSFAARPQTFVVTAVADRAQELLEADEANNRARRTLRQLPDLAVGPDNLALLPAHPLAGDTVAMLVTVRNAGSAPAPPTAVALFAGDPAAGGAEVARGGVPAIAPGGNRSLELSWTAAGGAAELVVVVDPDEELLEIDEGNNRARRQLAVPRPAGPNLEIAALDRAALVHSPLDLSLAGSVGVTLANRGDAAVAAAFLVRLFEDLDGDELFGGADRELGSQVVTSGVAAGASAAVSIAVEGTLAFAHSRVVVHADALDTIPETREDDNQRLLFADCVVPRPAASLDAVEEWYAAGIEIQNAPIVVQLSDDDGDGRIDSRDVADVVFHAADTQGRAVIALSGLDGSRLWTFRSSPANPLQHEKAHLSAADLDGDGVVEVVAVQTNNRLLALDHRGGLRWVSDPIEATGGDWRGGSAIGDLTGDGVPEIVVGRAVLSNTGRLLGVGTANAARNHNYYGPLGVGYLYDQQHAVIADVDLDGRNEVVAGDTVYRLVDGVLTIVWDAREHDNMLKDGFSAVANLDADPYPEIVYVSAGFVKVYNHDGSTRTPYRRIVPLPIPISFDSQVTFWGGPPTVADLTGDGVPEILVAGDTELVAMTAGLGTLWRKPIFDYAAMTAATAFDLDGDGRREVIYADESWLYVLDGRTGATLHQRKNTSLTGTELPVVADVDGDGRAEILVPSSRHRNGDRSTVGLHALGHASWVGARPIWNQHSYHVTNVQLDGTVPSPEAPSWQLLNSFRANLELPAAPLRLPNLTLGLPRVGAAGGQGIPVVLRVGNGGTAWAPAGVEVTLYATGDPTPVGTATTRGGLAPGGWEDVTIHWQGALAEPVAATATVDPRQRVAQCERGDDQLAFAVSESLLPDLAIPPGGATLGGGTPTAGQLLSLTVQVRNDGRAAAPPVELRVFDGSGAAAPVVGEAAVPDLAPGEASVLGVTLDTLALAPGLHSFRVVADPQDLVAETEEANNTAVVQVQLAEATRPDLHAATLAVVPPVVTAGQPALLRAAVRNRGAALPGGFSVSFRVNRGEVARVEYPGALAAGQSVTLEHQLTTLGRKGTLLVEAVADPQNTIAEVSESNNAVAASLSVLSSPLAVAVTTDRSRYRPAETVLVTVSAVNASSEPLPATLVILVQDARGVEVARLADQAVALAAGASSFPFAWPATFALPGPYAVVGRFEQNGTPLAQGSAGFSISADVAVRAELLADRAAYAPHGTVILHGGVRNESTSTLLDGAIATLRVVAPGGAEALRRELPIAQLLPEAFLPLRASWEVGTAAPGAYRGELTVRNAFGELLASATASFRVEDSAQTGAGLRGALTVSPRVQGAGGPVAAAYRVDNRGNAAVPGLVVHLELLDLTRGQTVASFDQPRPVVQGGSVDGVWRIDTEDLAPGSYIVSLAAVVGTVSERLASEPLSVLPGLLADDLAVREGNAGTSTAAVTVRLLAASAEPVTVGYATADGSATAGVDYEAAAGTLTFAPGQTEQSLAITLFGDTVEELHETFLVELAGAAGAAIADPQAVVTIEDEEGCASGNLLRNPGAEEGALEGVVAGWQPGGGGGWRTDFADPPSFDGLSYFAAGVAGGGAGAATAELFQDVALAPFAALIDGGGQELVFEGFAWSPGGARAVVEYRDGGGAVLDAYDSGPLPAVDGWSALVDRRVVPPGARTARVRLLAAAAGKSGFDRLALRSLGVVTLSAAPQRVFEGAGSAVLPLALSCSSPGPVAVQYATTDLEARAGEDYQAKTGTAIFAAGVVGATVVVPLLADTLDEDDERLSVHLDSTDVIVLTAAPQVTILDDDGTVSVAAAPAAVSEGDAGTVDVVFPLTLSAPSGREVRVDYATKAGSAGAGSDFAAVSGTVVFAPGETAGEVRVPVLGDLVDELNEAFQLTLARPVNAILATPGASGTIVDDDSAEMRIADAEVVEGDANLPGTALVRVTLSVPSDRPVAASYATVDGTATSPADYAASSGTVAFAAGATLQTVAVSIVGDDLEETTESFLVVLANASNAELVDSEATVTVIDEDGPVLTIDDVSLLEGNRDSTEAVFTITSLRPPHDVLWVDDAPPAGASLHGDGEGWTWVSANPAPFSGARSHQSALLSGVHQHYFLGATSRLTVNAGDVLVAYVYLDPANPPSQVMLQWHDGSWEHRAYWGANLIGWGVNGTNSRRFMGALPPAGQWVRLEVPAGLVGLEGRTLNGMAFTLHGGRATWDHAGKGQHYNPASTRTVTVDVTTVDGEAIAGEDYAPFSTTLTFAPGETVKTVSVSISGDKLEEPDETFRVRLAHPENAAIAKAEGRGTILDDDVFTLDVADLYLVESRPEAILALRLNRASEDEIRVDLATVDDVARAGADYAALAQTVVFAPGETERRVSVTLHDDAVHEGPERFWVDLSQAVGVHLARPRVGVHLLDDEQPASYPLVTTVRDFKASHPDIHNCSSVPRPATLLGGDGKMVHASGGTGATTFAQWYRDTPGVNLTAGYDITFTRSGASFQYWATDNFWPIDGKLYGNEGSHNYQFTTELHAWFTYTAGATLLFGSDDDGWCFVNNRLAIDLAACHGPTSRTINLDGIAASHGLTVGEVYRLDCFQAERGRGVSGFYFQTPLYLQQFEPGTLQLQPRELAVGEGSQATLQVQRIGGAFGRATARAVVTGGEAEPGVDFEPLDVALAFAHADRGPRSVAVRLLDDNLEEGHELLEVGLVDADPQHVVTPFSRATLTLVDDESFPVPVLLSAALPEGSLGQQSVLVGIALEGDTRFGATIHYATADGTATAGGDYQAKSGTLQFSPGQTHRYFELLVVGDTQPEGDEWLDLVLTGSGFRGGSARLRIELVDDDRCLTPNLVRNWDFSQAVSGGQVPEWTIAAGVWVNHNHGSSWNGLNVHPGNTTLGEIFQDIDLAGFEPFVERGQQRFAFRVDVASWSAENPPDTTRFVLELRDVLGRTLLSVDSREAATFVLGGVMSTVVNAPQGTRSLRVRLIGKRYSGSESNSHFDRVVLRGLDISAITASDVSFAEGHAGVSQVSLPVGLSCPSAVPVSVDFFTRDETAAAGQDYERALGTLVIAPGAVVAAVPLTLIGDTVTEGNETFTVGLQNPTGAVVPDGSLRVTIVDDESLLSIGNAAKNEGDEGSSLLELTVTLDKVMTLPVTVDYATADYSALAGEDYVATAGTLTFAPGETQKKIAVEILGDTAVEPDEELFVDLSNSNNAGIAQGRGVAKIKQDDIEITIADARVTEGNAGTRTAVFALALSSASSQPVTVGYRTVDGLATAPADYTAKSGTLTFPAGQTLLDLAVTVHGDTLAEGSETFLVLLENPQNAFVRDGEASGFIVDDDDCPSPNLLANPGAEQVTSGELSFWREVVGTTWGIRNSSPSPVEGASYFAAGNDALAELAQDVDVTAFAQWIDLGVQRFSFEGFVRTAGTPLDVARIVVEYLDAAKARLASADTGAIADASVWRYVSDLSTAPVGTRWIRVRLLGSRQRSSGANFSFFDGLSLRSLGTPFLVLPDQELFEGDDSDVVLPYEVRLSCAGERPVSLAYATVDGSARAGSDYTAVSGTLTFAPGEVAKTVAITTHGDFLSEIRETFRLEVRDVVNAVVLDGVATVTLADADLGLPVRGQTRIYTLDEDFDLGFAAGVHHEAPLGDQLQLAEQGGTFPFLWVAASGRGTIVKIDTRSGRVLGEYSTNPDNRGNSDPSRTTVSFDGSVWVGNRGDGSVTHVGLLELGQCVDRNGNGTIETSAGYGNVLKWPNAQGQDTNGGVSTAADECILHYKKMRQSIPRHVSVDPDGNIWVGGYAGACSHCFDLLDGTTAATLRQVSFTCGGYGGFVASDGVLWSSGLGPVLRWDPSQPTSTARCLSTSDAYGLAVARDGHVFANSHGSDLIYRISRDGTKITSFPRGASCGQGLAIDGDDQIWSSSSRWCSGTRIAHRRTDGVFVGTLDNVPTGTTGISVDDSGKIWAVADQANKVFRIDPAGGPIGADGVTRIGAIDLVVDIPGANAYNYSDMTGYQALRHTLRQGSWSTIQDAGIAGAEWGVVAWNTEPQASVPAGSAIVVEVRTAETILALSSKAWQPVGNGVRFERFGRFLQVRVTLRLGTASLSPVLSDLRIGIHEPEVRVGDATVTEGDEGSIPATFAVTLHEPAAHPVTIAYRTVAGTAAEGVDYEATSGTLTIPAGELAAAITVPVRGDREDEEDESFTLELLSAVGGRLVDPRGLGTILDDDTRLLVGATKVDHLHEDADGNGLLTPGDVLAYTIVIANTTEQALPGLAFEDPVPAHTAIVPGSVTTTSGSVAGEDPVRVTLAELAPGATATITFRVRLAVPWPAAVPAVVNQGGVTGLAGGPVLTDDPDEPGAEDPTRSPLALVPVLYAAKVDALHEDADGDGRSSPGDLVAYEIVVRNSGVAPASAVVLDDAIPEHTTLVAGSVVSTMGQVLSENPVRVALGELAAGAEAAVGFVVRVRSPLPVGVAEIRNQGSLGSAELPAVLSDDPELPGRQDPTVTPLAAAPRLHASKSDVLAIDADGDGQPSPGDTIGYTVVVRNGGNTGATGVALLDPIPEHTELVFGSVTASRGRLLAVDPIQLEIGELPAGEEATLSFQVRIVHPVAPWVLEVSNQATVLSAELPDLASDDPELPGEADPTTTPVSASPVLSLAKADALVDDRNGDGFASPGEVVLYQLALRNSGNTAATEVVLSDPLPEHATLLPGTVQTSLGEVRGEDPVEVVVGTVPVDTTVTVSFRVRIDEPFPEGATELANQATVVASELAPLPSDDPDTPETGDPTRTEVVPPIEVTVADVVVGEVEGAATFTVTLSRPARAGATLRFAAAPGSAASGADFTAVAGTLVIAAGESSATIEVPVLDDALDELDETFTLVLSAPVGLVLVDAEAVGTIRDDDAPPVLAVADVAVSEGNEGTTPAVFVLTLSGPSGLPITVAYATAPGTAGAADFAGSSGTAAFAPGETVVEVPVAVRGDLLDEDDESFTLQLGEGQQVTLAREAAVGTILDDDAPPALTVSDVTVSEGDAGTTPAIFTLTLSAASGREVQVRYATAPREAAAGVDYQEVVGVLAIPAGATTAAVTVPVLGDRSDEPEERFELRLSEPVHLRLDDELGLGTILDDDAPPTLAVGDVTVHEGDDGLAIVEVPVVVSVPSGFVITAGYVTADDTAREPVDYLPAADSLLVAAGSGAGALTVRVRGDRVDELDERFVVRLAGATNATIADAEGVVTIIDDDEALLRVGDVTVTEGDSGTTPAVFPVELSTPSDRAVSVAYATEEGTATAAVDYRAASGGLLFAAGETTASVVVEVVGDLLLEPDEQLTLRLSAPVHAAFADPVGVATIIDDEVCPGPELVGNGGGEARPAATGTIPGWSAVGPNWSRVATPAPFAGSWSLAAPVGALVELRQDVDLRAFAAVDELRLALRGAARATGGGRARLLVELRDAANSTVLATVEPEAMTAAVWTERVEVVAVPAGSGWARLRLLAERPQGATVAFDGLSLRSLRVPALSVGDMSTYEGDSGQHDGVFPVRLACAYAHEVSASYNTVDGTATAGLDYLATSGEVTFPAGSTEQPVPVPVLGDLLYEGHERMALVLSEPEGGAVLLDGEGRGSILDDDFCARSPGYWKTHPESWPVDWLLLGGREVGRSELQSILGYNGPDGATHLARQLIATKLNLLVGSDPWIAPTVTEADGFLALYPPGSNPRGAAKTEANRIKDVLDRYNTTKVEGCTETVPRF